MKLAALLLLSGCASTTVAARSAFATTYACDDSKVTAVDLGQPTRGSSANVVEVAGCGRTAKYTCTSDDCLAEPDGATFRATDETSHATSGDAGLASAVHDLACDPTKVTRVTPTIYEGCGERATYRVFATNVPPPMRFVLTARVPLP